MGVQGLWQLLHPAGKPVSPSSLEGKVLAVDVSIWLHQTMKGMRDKDGSPLPNAHLQGLFSRVCKLLFYRIRPVFVFDGGVPALKKQTLAVRRERKENIDREKGQSTQKILENLLQSHAVRGVTGDKTQRIAIPAKPGGQQDMFELPPLPEVDKGSADPMDSTARMEAEEDEFEDHRNLVQYYQEEFQNLEDIDCESEEFLSLPPEIRHEILTEMKEQRRENALARISIMPEESGDFSDYQLKKLLKKSKLSNKIESVRKEMNTRVSKDITYALGDDYYGEVVEAQRVVSEDAAHYVLIKGLTNKQQVAEAERCKARRLSKENREAKRNSDGKIVKFGTASSLNSLKEEPEEEMKEDIKVESTEGNLSVPSDEMLDEDQGKLYQREKRGKSLVTRNGLRSVAKKSCGKNRSTRKKPTTEDLEDEVTVTSEKNGSESFSGTKTLREVPCEQDGSEFLVEDDESNHDSNDDTSTTIRTEIITPIITSHNLKESDDAVTSKDHLEKATELTDDSNICTNNFAADKSTFAEEKSNPENDTANFPEDQNDFAETRSRLLTEEEDLLKAKEAKMATLMKSLEKRAQVIQTPQAQRKSSIESTREKLIQQEEDLMKEKEAKMAALLKSVEKYSQLKSGQLPVSTQKETDPDLQFHLTETVSGETDMEGKKKGGEIKCRATSQGFLDDVAEMEQRAIAKKVKAKMSDRVNSSEPHMALISSSSSSAFPALSADYLEDIEGTLKSDDVENTASSQPKSVVTAQRQEKPACFDVDNGDPTKQTNITERVKGTDRSEKCQQDFLGDTLSTNQSDLSQKKMKRVSSEKLQENAPEKKTKVVPSASRTSQDEAEDSEDEGFIEITIDPSKIPHNDDLFPSSIFASVPDDNRDTTLHQSDKDKIIKKPHDLISDYKNAKEENDVGDVEEDNTDEKTKNNSESDVEEVSEVNEKDRLPEGNFHLKDEIKLTKPQSVPSVSLGRQESSERSSEISVNEEDETGDGGQQADMPAHFSQDKNVQNFTKGVNSLIDLFDLQHGLAAERRTLTLERGRQARLGKTVTEQISMEAQELLQLFGLPYVVSPMEAESQCAHLELLGLTEGTITDDSDSWLFGATNVYKNFFNQSKYVEYYSDRTVFQRFGMDREKLINIALLCGSDYTPGIPGVGPVRAMEILAEFPGEGLEGLKDFRDWWKDAKMGIIPRNQGKIRNKLRNLELHEGFPSRQVVDAYLKPAVDESEETFTWGLPDLDLLRQYAKMKFGWGKQKSDEVLEPMMKELTKKTAQGRIHTYFHPENFVCTKPVQSKRLQAALEKFQAQEEESGSSSSQSHSESDSDSASQSESGSEDSDSGEEEKVVKKSKITQQRGKGRGSTGRGGTRRGRGAKSDGPKLGVRTQSGRGRGDVSHRQSIEDTFQCGRGMGEQSEGMKSEIKIQRGRGRRGKSNRQHKEVTVPSVEVQSVEQNAEVQSRRVKGRGGHSVIQQAEGALSRGGRGGRGRGQRSGNRNPKPLVSKQQRSMSVLLQDEVCLSESSSSEDDSQRPTAKKQNPDNTLKHNTTHTLIPSKLPGTKDTTAGRKKSKGPNVKQLLPSTAQAQTVKRKTSREPTITVGRKVVKMAEDESVAAFKQALGDDLDPQTMTVDDLGSDFSDG